MKNLKSYLQKYPLIDDGRIEKKLRNCKIVSFDIYDTLIKRLIPNQQLLYKNVATNNNIKKATKIDIEKFCQDRESAEEKARSLSQKKEITINQIYDIIRETYGDISDELKEEEIRLEIMLTCSNIPIKKIYDWCVENGKKIVVISDTYLPEKVIKTILNQCGYHEIEEYYCSSEYGDTKITGELFLDAISNENTTPNEWVHIGDSFKYDCINACAHKMRSVKIPRIIECNCFFRRKGYTKKGNDANFYDLKYIINNSKLGIDTNNPYFGYGYEILGPALFGFVTWIKKRALDLNIKNLFFLARDGYLLQKAYQVIADDEISYSYLYMSRKALLLPYYYVETSYEVFTSLIPRYRYIRFEDVLAKLKLTIYECKEEIIKSEINLSKQYYGVELLESRELSTFYNLIRDKLFEKAKHEYEILFQYLKQERFEGRLAIVDVGWSGTIQKYLTKICKHMQLDVEIIGLYLGTKNKSKDKMEGYSDELGKNAEFSSCVVEFPLLAGEGSTLGYEYIDKCIVPIQDQYEYADCLNEKKIIKDIQKGCLKSVKILYKCYGKYFVSPIEACNNLYLFSKRPRLYDVKLFGSLLYNDGELKPMICQKKYIKQNIKLRNIRSELSATTWKIGYLKKNLFITFPYEAMLLFIRKLAK